MTKALSGISIRQQIDEIDAGEVMLFPISTYTNMETVRVRAGESAKANKTRIITAKESEGIYVCRLR